MELYYDPLDRACKSRTGAIPRKSRLTFNLYLKQGGEEHFSADVCTLVLGKDGCEQEYYPMRRTESGWTLTLRFNRTGLWFYYFRLGEDLLVSGRFRKGTLARTRHSCWQITVYDEHYKTPDWFKGGLMYQIFPDRFCKSGELPAGEGKILRNWGETPYYRPNSEGKVLNNDFFGGNFRGVREKLGYLSSLGVTVLYFNPIFEAYSNHRYDTGDYMKIDPLLGTEEDFITLVKDAEALGMRVILDGVFNHTGSDSRYFNRYGRYPSVGAYQSPDSPYADWYNFHPFPNNYDSWWGVETLPAVNERSPSYQEFIFGEDGVIKHWLRRGAAGYRLDVADELPDFFLQKLRRAVKEENPEAIVIGEVWEDASNKIAYGERREYFRGEELDSVMNYPLKDAIIGFLLSGCTEQLRDTIATLIDNYPQDALHSLMNILGTHDTPRALTVFGRRICTDKDEMASARLSDEEKARAKELLKCAVLLQYTLPGVPCIYYGDENGMEGYLDPFCRRCFDWEHTDEDLLSFYRKMGKLRADRIDILKNGGYREIFADVSCLVYERRAADKALYVFVNRSRSKYEITFEGKFEELLTGKIFSGTFGIEPMSFGVIARAE